MTMNETLKRVTADIYAVVKDEEKVTVGAPPVCYVSHAEFLRVYSDCKAMNSP